MPQPYQSQVHINAPLTNISVAYMQDAANFVAPVAFPAIPVEKASDLYFTYDKGAWFRDEAQKRQGSTESAGSGYGISTASYSCDVFAFHKDVDDKTRANADTPLDMDRDATLFVTNRLMLKQEIVWMNNFFAAGKWGTDLTPTALWSSLESSDPINDVETGKQSILSTTGFMPNTLILGYEVYRVLRNHPDMIDRVKYGGSSGAPATINERAMAEVFGVDRVLVSKAIQNTAKEGATDAFSFLAGKNALLCYSAPNPGILTPSAGYTFMWKGVSGGLGKSVGIKKFRIPQIASDRVEGETAFDHKLVAADLGYFFSGAVA